MIGAELLNDEVINEFLTIVGLGITGFFTYLAVKVQVKKVGFQVGELDLTNTEQHGVNAEILGRMLDRIAEQGVMVSAMVNVQDHPIIKTDPTGALIQVNAAGVKLLGMAPHELTGDGWVNAVHVDDRRRVFTAWMDAVANKRPFGPLSYRYHHPVTGVDTLVEAVATPVVGINDELISWVAVIVPITKV
jgi:PAS domain S-box-containing protein